MQAEDHLHAESSRAMLAVTVQVLDQVWLFVLSVRSTVGKLLHAQAQPAFYRVYHVTCTATTSSSAYITVCQVRSLV